MKVLIVEDEPVSRRLLEAFLQKWGYQVLIACDGKEAMEAIQGRESPSLIVSDWMMPGMDGLDLCRYIRNKEREGYIYFILLTAKGSKEDIVSGLEAGADDYLTKPFDREELKCRIRIGERIINLEQQIRKLAATDALTGVLNRRVFMERMEQEINRTNREHQALSLVLTDIDHFKKINDRYGHQAGDLVLKRFTEQLKKISRSYDFIGRYGGEEFTICLPGTDEQQSLAVAERMRGEIEGMKVSLPDNGEHIGVTASFGLTSFIPGSEDGIDPLVKRADEALYRAKSEGRNRVCTAGRP